MSGRKIITDIHHAAAKIRVTSKTIGRPIVPEQSKVNKGAAAFDKCKKKYKKISKLLLAHRIRL